MTSYGVEQLDHEKRKEMTQYKILILEDIAAVAQKYKQLLEEEGYQALASVDCAEFFEAFDKFEPDAVLLDIQLSGCEMNGIEIFRTIKIRKTNIPEVIVISGEASRSEVAEAMKLGAYSFIEKTGLFDVNKFLLDVKYAVERKRQRDYVISLEHENKLLRERSLESIPLIGSSEAITKLRQQIERLANTDVLILGETGTGKEIVARHLHIHSTRYTKPFISLNCAAIPESLVESTLFGHAKGSFTGATNNQKGAFEKAAGGILFLDEVNSLSLKGQGVILRAVEQKTFYTVGGKEVHVDLQVIYASNKNLQALVDQGAFREDLYYRINGNVINIPSLISRGGDIIQLFSHFMQKQIKQVHQNKALNIDYSKLKQVLTAYGWPGNVRELERFCYHLMNSYDFINNDTIVQEMALKSSAQNEKTSLLRFLLIPELKNSTEAFEKEYIVYHLRKHDWKIDKAAEIMNIDRTTLYKKIERYEIKRG
jgi:DNA-binding NtrC family response regulator